LALRQSRQLHAAGELLWSVQQIKRREIVDPVGVIPTAAAAAESIPQLEPIEDWLTCTYSRSAWRMISALGKGFCGRVVGPVVEAAGAAHP
jgi:hypothetical protein